jgi:23S rRNA pseudouridine2605 synthase
MKNNYSKNKLSRAGSREQQKPAPKTSRATIKPGTKKTEDKNAKFSSDRTKNRVYKSKTNTEKRVSKKPVYSDEIRLNRFIANAGICSRREADTYITSGIVTVNGQIVTELGIKVKPGDEVRFDGRRLTAEKKVYLLLNKPKDYVTTTEDPHADKTVMELIKDACIERVYPVGRLDRNTTGLLLFTNDGDLSKKLTHPSHRMKKVYQVSLDKALTKEHMLQIADGIELEDGLVAADALSYVSPDDKCEIGIEIHSGKNRIVRRIFEHLGYRVKKLDRVYFAGLTKKNLPRGKYRLLTEKEVQFLKMQ